MRWLSFGISLMIGCSENAIYSKCAVDAPGFDIEDVSVLEDAQGLLGMHDAIVLEVDTSQLGDTDTWRVSSVDIFPMLPTSLFDFYADGQTIAVEIWDADEPTGTPYAVSQIFQKDSLTWEPRTLSNPSTAWDANQQAAWWSFDFRDTIPSSGMSSQRYIVGIAWEDSFDPPMGYSNYNQPCDQNWTDYNDGAGWVLNGDNSGSECSWPMMRVNLEVIEEATECEEGSTLVQ